MKEAIYKTSNKGKKVKFSLCLTTSSKYKDMDIYEKWNKNEQFILMKQTFCLIGYTTSLQ
jgi:hypothetical protein